MATYIEINSLTDVIVGLHIDPTTVPEVGDGFELIEVDGPPPEGLIAYQVWDRENNVIIDTPRSTAVRMRWALSQSDWKVIRHRDQIDAGATTSLTDEEYQQLLTDRQLWRDAIIV